MFKVTEINRAEDLDHYHLVWQSLLAQTRGASFFQSLPWLQSYWKHFGQGQKLRLLLVRNAAETIGIVPLAVEAEATRAGTVRTLTYPLHDWSTFYGPLGANASGTLAAAMRHIAGTRRDWDLLDLRWVDKPAVDRGRTPMALLAAGLAYREHVWKETALVDLSGTWEEYLATRSLKFRGNVRRLERRFLELKGASYERYRPLGSASGDDDPRWDLYDACLDLAERSWQGSSKDGTTLSHPKVRDFLRETHVLAAKAGALDMNLLRHGRRPVAFGYGYHYQGCVTGLRMGYDPNHAKLGLGQVITAFTLRDSFERGDVLFDLGPGSFETKLPWLTRVAASYRYTHYPLGSLRAQALRLKHWLVPQTRQHYLAGETRALA
jgi:CelD/BcsL family acetyltransferase involved in cellulose biosynthesis